MPTDARRKNILFIMFDQLRFDYLGCTGHPHLETPNIDALAARALRFSRCYVQSPICGAARMSYYTGRYVSSHGAAWNNYPLKVGEVTLGDHLRDIGMDAYLIGKTHMAVDKKGMQRLGLTPESVIGARVSECGFDVFTRDDGLWPKGPDGDYSGTRHSPYNAYLADKGYDGENPWHDYANAGVDDDGNIASGFIYANARLPANIREEDSETPWLTREAMRFLETRKAGAKPWLCHLSYIKPHWPYIVPAPYHDMYDRRHFLPARRHTDELKNPNPVYAAFAESPLGKAFSRDDVREATLTAYMGLIKQIDDQMGVLFRYLEDSGQMDSTMIVITSDHGDYLGDHWLGEKNLFHDVSARVPLIIYDPSREADATRGQVNDSPVEGIDLAATFIDFAGGAPRDEVIEGKSLMPFLRGESPADWRDYAISEYDYSISPMADVLNVSSDDARLFMVATSRWKFMHAEGGFAPMLFDLEADPDELHDLGRDPGHAGVIAECYEKLFEWARRCSQRTTIPLAEHKALRGKSLRKGVVLGVAGKEEADPELMVKYTGPARQIHIREKE